MSKEIVFANPSACDGYIIDYLSPIRNRFSKVIISKHKGEIEALAEKYANKGFNKIIAAGGDGTVNEVINGLIKSKNKECAFGVLPLGIGNDFCNEIGVFNIEEGIKAIKNGKIREINIGKINKRYFVAHGSIGFPSFVLMDRNNREKWLAREFNYLLSILRMVPIYKPLTLEISVDENKPIKESIFSVFINNIRFCAKILKIAPEARLDDDKLDICIVKNKPLTELLLILPSVCKGTHLDATDIFAFYQGKRITLKSEDKFFVEIDGEELEELNEACFEVADKKIKVIIP